MCTLKSPGGAVSGGTPVRSGGGCGTDRHPPQVCASIVAVRHQIHVSSRTKPSEASWQTVSTRRLNISSRLSAEPLDLAGKPAGFPRDVRLRRLDHQRKRAASQNRTRTRCQGCSTEAQNGLQRF